MRLKFAIYPQAMLVLFLFTSQCSKNGAGGVDDDEQDKTPPLAISDLTVVSVTTSSITLEWTAPADYRDDHSAGMLQEYDLRVSYTTITAANFTQGHRIDSVPPWSPPGSKQLTIVETLEPDSTYYFAMKVRDDNGNWSAISNCCHGHCKIIEVVHFADSVLERIIREHIQKPTGDIMSPDLDTITELQAVDEGITRLSGLEHCSSLQNILMANNSISDLSPLSGLTHLWGIHLTWNNISDMSPLAGLTAVTQLHLGINPIADISTISTMTGLQQVWLYETYVVDFTPLQSLPYLQDIHLGSSGISDISFMSGLTHVVTAQLITNSITDLTPLTGLTTLENLGVGHNQVVNIGPLQGLTSLRNLDLTYNGITDILPLVNNSGIGTGDFLYLGENPLSAQSVNEYIPALQTRGATVYH